MSRQMLRPVKVWTDEKGQPKRWQWRETVYSGRVLLVWNLSAYWWDDEKHSNRMYYRMETPDHQVFELYQDLAKDNIWVLARIQD
jgi:hypothetical protein